MRVIPNVAIDWFSVGLAVMCLIGLVGGMHFFFTWLHREIAAKRAAFEAPEDLPSPVSSWKWRTTLSIVGIFVLMFVAGIFVVGGLHQLVWMRTRSR